jgi:hypothetical protein
MKKILLFIPLIFVFFNLWAQTETKEFNKLMFINDSVTSINSKGNVTITQDIKIEQAIYNYSRAYKSKPQKVWRVQIYFGTGATSKNVAQSTEQKFKKLYPETTSYIIYEEPHFKVRVGDFHNRIEAEQLKSQIIEDYPNSFIIEDEKK